jgi:putative peptide zinc metalloprotease protein
VNPEAKEERLLALRRDLELHPAPPAPDGSPQWTISDPLTHTFYRIGWAEFALLSRWQAGDTPAALCARVNAEHGLEVGDEDVSALQAFLLQHEMLQVGQPAWTAELLSRRRKAKRWGLNTLLHGYLFFRVPLLRPDRLLAALLPMARTLASRPMLALYGVCTLAGVFLVLRNWDSFAASMIDTLTPTGIAGYALTLALVKIAHEFGHALTARHAGLRVPTMGVAFILAWPVLYTDTTDAWKLESRRARLSVTGAGMAVELVLAGLATLAWALLPEGPLRSAAFMLASLTWISTLAINLNPFMRFDGYYLFSDWLEVPNLQERSFALARWWLRERCLALGDEVPEHLPLPLRRTLIAYGVAVWIYRVILFGGIALLLYHVVLAPLGPLLALFEVGFFLVMPAWRELREWPALSRRGRPTRGALAVAASIAALVLLLALPWATPVMRTALLRPAEYAQVRTPEPAQIEAVLVREGETVAAGQVLMRLRAPELDFDTATAESELRTQAWQLERSRTVRELLDFGGVAEGRYAQALAESRSLAERRLRLTLRAATAGRVTGLEESLVAGRWVTPEQTLMLVVDDRRLLVETYVEAADQSSLSQGASARFYPDEPGRAPLALRIAQVDAHATREIGDTLFADRHHGDIPTRVDAEGNTVSNESVYRVLLEPADPAVEALPRMLRGEVRLPRQGSSALLDALRRSIAVLRRESGV